MAQSLSLKTLHLAGKINMVPKKENHSKCARHSEKGKANGGLEQSEIPWRKWALSWTLQSATLHAHGRYSEWMPMWLHLPLSSDQTQRYKKPDRSAGVKAQDNTHLASGMAGVGVGYYGSRKRTLKGATDRKGQGGIIRRRSSWLRADCLGNRIWIPGEKTFSFRRHCSTGFWGSCLPCLSWEVVILIPDFF